MKKLLTILFIGIAGLYAQTVPSYVPTNGLVGWWPFNGNANDESGNGNNGSYVAGVNPTSDRNGASNSAMGFSGQGSITLSNLPTTGSQDFTIAGWLSTSSANTARKGIACWGQDIPWQSTYFFVNTNGKLAFDFAYNAGPTSTASVNDAQWHFISVTNSNGFIQLYVDGVPNGQGMQMSLPNITGNTKSIGSNLSGGGTQNNFAGKLDDIAIWDRALTSSEIQNIYNQINTNTSLPTYVPANGLVGWWPFNGNANDESGNYNNGTTNGATLTSDRYGNVNRAYNFIQGNTINIPNSASIDNLSLATVNLWFKTATSSNAALFKKGNSLSLSTAEQISIQLNMPNGADGFTAKYNSNCTPGNGWVYCSNSQLLINDSTWHMLTAVIDIDSLSYFIDGMLVSATAVPNTAMDICNGGGIVLGKNWNSDPDYYNGIIDDVGFWNRPLTRKEVTNLYRSCPDSLTTQPQNFTAYSSTGWANFRCKSSDTAATYQWQQGNGAGWIDLTNIGNYSGTTSDSLVITGVTATMNNYGYRCIVTGCTTDTSDVAVLTVENGIGLGESALQKLTVSPNPTASIVSLNTAVVGTYELLTLDGRVLESGTAKKDYDLTTYPKGVYHLRLSTDEGSRVLKVVKN